MTQTGVRVLLKQLFGDSETAPALQQAIGKTIWQIELDPAANYGNGALRLTFTDDTLLLLYDDGQNCCESRYMTTDDDLNYHWGATLVSIEVRNGPEPFWDEEKDEQYEQQFLVVTTSKGAFTATAHNRHNGYYGGFALAARSAEE